MQCQNRRRIDVILLLMLLLFIKTEFFFAGAGEIIIVVNNKLFIVYPVYAVAVSDRVVPLRLRRFGASAARQVVLSAVHRRHEETWTKIVDHQRILCCLVCPC